MPDADDVSVSVT